MNLSKTKAAYLAGFLDGDGSIYVKLKPNKTYRYRFQVSINIVFFQSIKEEDSLKIIQKIVKRGYLRQRKDNIVEYIIGDEKSIVDFLELIEPFLILKKKQAKLMLKIIKNKKKVKSGNDFLRLAKEIDKFRELNYSKKRINTSREVEKVLKKERFITP